MGGAAWGAGSQRAPHHGVVFICLVDRRQEVQQQGGRHPYRGGVAVGVGVMCVCVRLRARVRACV